MFGEEEEEQQQKESREAKEKETQPAFPSLVPVNTRARVRALLQLEVIVKASVRVVRATARLAPAEGGGGPGEWVTSRGRRQAV